MNDTPSMSPIHPGEVLLHEYLEPFGASASPSTSWRWLSACRHDGSTRSCTASAASAPTRPFAWRDTSAPPNGSGSTSSPATTWRSSVIAWRAPSGRSSRSRADNRSLHRHVEDHEVWLARTRRHRQGIDAVVVGQFAGLTPLDSGGSVGAVPERSGTAPRPEPRLRSLNVPLPRDGCREAISYD